MLVLARCGASHHCGDIFAVALFFIHQVEFAPLSKSRRAWSFSVFSNSFTFFRSLAIQGKFFGCTGLHLNLTGLVNEENMLDIAMGVFLQSPT